MRGGGKWGGLGTVPVRYRHGNYGTVQVRNFLFLVHEKLPVKGVDGGVGEGREGGRYNTPFPRRRRGNGGAKGGTGQAGGAGHASRGATPS